MRRAHTTGWMAMLATAAAMSACTMPATQQANRGAVVDGPAPARGKAGGDPRASGADQIALRNARGGEHDIEALTRSIQEQAGMVRTALAEDAATEASAGNDNKSQRQVEWIDARPAPRRTTPTGATAVAKASSSSAAKDGSDRAPVAPGEVIKVASAGAAAKTPTTQPAPTAAVARPTVSPAIAALPANRHVLLDQYAQQLRAGDDPLLSRVMLAAALATLDPARNLDPALLEQLNPEQRERALRLHAFMRDLGQLGAAGQNVTDLDTLRERIDEHASAQPVRIRGVHLCRRVTGFGVYEPFENYSFMAGKENPVIVYVEVDNFRSVKTANDQYEVRLQQEVTLFNDADGLAVWRQPAVEVVDQSRNRRRDFFVVQLIKLPPRLTVGKYRLKVRVTDPGGTHGGSLFETSVPLQIVADQALASSGKN